MRERAGVQSRTVRTGAVRTEHAQHLAFPYHGSAQKFRRRFAGDGPRVVQKPPISDSAILLCDNDDVSHASERYAMPQNLVVTVLTVNAPADGLRDEWGLSLHVRYGDLSLLLDFGQSDAFAENAHALGIDLADVDLAVLSHAHYDHADGMDAFFAANDRARLHLSAACDESCWSTKGGTDDAHYIGVRAGLLERFSDRLSPVPTDRVSCVAPGVHLIPHTAPGLVEKGARDGMLLKTEDGWRPDDFAHELSLVLELNGPEGPALCVFNSCSHAGMGVILREVAAAFPGVPIAAFVGGLHLFRSPDEDVLQTGTVLRDAGVRWIWTGHCTGDRALELLANELPNRVHELRPGRSFLVDAIDWQEPICDVRDVDLRVMLRRSDKQTWGAHETGRIELPHDGGGVVLPVAYDEREAPFVIEPDGTERTHDLISLSDEDDLLACAWTHVEGGSDVCGVGVDLASREDFGPRPGTERFCELMFSERERELAQLLYPHDLPLAYATLFGAKEAAFKATAHALREWYQTHDEPLEFEVRDFGMTELGVERGELRRGNAQTALDRMGIARIEIYHAQLRDQALVLALARKNL